MSNHRVQTYWCLDHDGGYVPAVSLLHGLSFTAIEGDDTPGPLKPVVVTVRADEAALARLRACPHHGPGCVRGEGQPGVLEPAQSLPVMVLPVGCTHRWLYTGELVRCGGCKGNVRLKVFMCEVCGQRREGT